MPLKIPIEFVPNASPLPVVLDPVQGAVRERRAKEFAQAQLKVALDALKLIAVRRPEPKSARVAGETLLFLKFCGRHGK